MLFQTHPKNLALSWGFNYVFKDSFQFLPSSLAALAENLRKDAGEHGFKFLCSEFRPDEIPLLLRKGIYPYEYMNSFEKFEEEKLPPRDAFISALKHENISVTDYEFAKEMAKIWISHLERIS